MITGNPVKWIPLLILCFGFGCGEIAGGARVHVADVGLSMELPPGWVADRQNPRMFFDSRNREDNFGMVENYPLERQSLREYVDRMSNVAGAHLVSTAPVTISGHEAIEVVTEALYTVIEVDIQRGEEVIRVSFRALTEDYPAHEKSFRAALRSIELH